MELDIYNMECFLEKCHGISKTAWQDDFAAGTDHQFWLPV